MTTHDDDKVYKIPLLAHSNFQQNIILDHQNNIINPSASSF